MRILFCQKMGEIAGSETYLLNILPALKRTNINVEFLALHPKQFRKDADTFKSKLKASEIPCHSIEIGGFSTFSALLKINRLIRKKEYDIIHTHLIHADFYLALVKMIFQRKMILVSTKHGYEEEFTEKYGFDANRKKKNTYYIISKFAEKWIDRSFAISRGLYNLFCGLGICSPQKIEVISYGFNYDQSFSFRDEFRYGPQQLVIVGRLKAYKGHKYAFDVIKILKDEFPRIRLIIVGWGVMETELREYADELGITDHIIFTGASKTPRDYMFTSDLVLVPSISEGFGIVILEAMSVKRPVIAFDVPSPKDILENEKTGILIPPYDVKEFARKIADLLNNKSKCEEIAERAYQKLANEYTLDQMKNTTIQFYKKVLTSKGRTITMQNVKAAAF